MKSRDDYVVNVDEVEEVERLGGQHWGGADKVLTPSMRPRGGKLGVTRSRARQGAAWRTRSRHARSATSCSVSSRHGISTSFPFVVPDWIARWAAATSWSGNSTVSSGRIVPTRRRLKRSCMTIR